MPASDLERSEYRVDAAFISVNAKIWRLFTRRRYAHFQLILGISSHDVFLLSLRPKQPAAAGNLRPCQLNSLVD